MNEQLDLFKHIRFGGDSGREAVWNSMFTSEGVFSGPMFLKIIPPAPIGIKTLTLNKILKWQDVHTNVWSSWKPQPLQKKPRANSSWLNQLTTPAGNSTWHFKHVGNQFCITWHSLVQLINNSKKIMVKSPGGELSSAFGTSKDKGYWSIPIPFTCMPGGQERAVVVFLPFLFASLHWNSVSGGCNIYIWGFLRDWYGFMYNLCHDHFKPRAVFWFVNELSSEIYPGYSTWWKSVLP